MSPFWSAWISIITLAVIFGCSALLLMTRKSEKFKDATEATTGHVFDGIEELEELCQECNQNTLIRQEGCVKCFNCSYSRC